MKTTIYRCKDCGHLFEEDDIVVVDEGYMTEFWGSMVRYIHKVEKCPNCRSEDFVEVEEVECEKCGRDFYTEHDEYLCEKCREEENEI